MFYEFYKALFHLHKGKEYFSPEKKIAIIHIFEFNMNVNKFNRNVQIYNAANCCYI